MTHIVIANVGTGLSQAATTTEILNLSDDQLLAELAEYVAERDPAEHRTFRLYRLPMRDGMTVAEYYAPYPNTVAELEAANAEMVKEATVPMNRHSTNRFGD